MDSEPKALLGSWEVELATQQRGMFLTLLTCLVDEVARTQQANSLWRSLNPSNGAGCAWGEITYHCEVRLSSQTGQPTGQLKVEGALQFNSVTLSWHGPFQPDLVDADGQVHVAERGTFRSHRVEQDL